MFITMETEANRIKALRKNKGLTQGELAEAIGVSTVTISGAENGNKISVALNEHIAKYFKVSAEWLATGIGEKPKGLVIPIERGAAESPWKDEAYKVLKAENERLWRLIEKITGSAPGSIANFSRVLSVAGKHKRLPLNTQAA